MKIYTGIGSRETPPSVIEEMTALAKALSAKGYTLRSGGADGADTAFELGHLSVAGNGPVEIYLPWPYFNKHPSNLNTVCIGAFELASRLHPGWKHLTQGGQKLHARNCYQVLGKSLNTPSDFLVCWTPDGCESKAERTGKTGGTATAVVLAESKDIPIFNLKNATSRVSLNQYLASNDIEFRLKETDFE